MKGSQESLSTVVVKHGPPVPASSSTDGSRQGLWVDWRTPQANEAGARVETLYTKDGQPAKPGQRAYRKTPDGRMVLQSQTINQQVEMVQNWPTPEASQGGRQGGSFSQNSWKKEDGTPKQPSLAQATIMDQQVKNWATPRAEMDSGAHNGIPDTLHSQMKVQAVGKLNPRWVETLMGLPVGWTMPSCASPVTIERMSCDCSATALSRQQRSEPSEH